MLQPQTFGSYHSPPHQLHEDLFASAAHRFLRDANNHRTLPINGSDQTIEFLLSRLNLTSDDPPFHGHTTPIDDGGASSSRSIPPPMAFEGSHQQQQQQVSNWAQPSTTNGPLVAHHNINVGTGFSGRGPYPHNQLINYSQRQDFYNYFDHRFLHGTGSTPSDARYNDPVVPFARENSSLYALAQQLTPDFMVGKIAFLAKHQIWSGALVLKLEGGLGVVELNMVLLEVMECWDDLLRNQFGGQFVQKLFTVCDEDQRTRIIMTITRFPFKLISVCLHPSGTKSVQKLLEKLSTPQQISLVVASLIPGAVVLATDCKGQHIIHYCVRRFPVEYTKHLLSEITENCFSIGTSKSGCCVLQSCVDNARGEARPQLILAIIENAVQLAEDPYGNYVVQHLLEMGIPELTKYILRRFQGCFVSLSCNKYASNVVEKLLQSGDEVSVTIIIELLRSPNASMLLVDPYGNFVIQNALSTAKGELYDSLERFVQANEASMQNNLYGKKILAWFVKKKPYIDKKKPYYF
ncbi:pumilio 15-like [Salvia divinorum]|uniref:Pumilio 15-like n=1 Tax=Salvia divinorum TaxID=28513 RepID=A0ABD1G8A5_SALDI